MTISSILHALAVVIFEFCFALILWSWIVYPTLLTIWGALTHQQHPLDAVPSLPIVSIVVAVHNEEQVVAARLKNCLEQEYPADKLEIVVAADRCTDGTVPIVCSFDSARVKLVLCDAGGKSSAQNAAIPESDGEIIVLSDAETEFAPDFIHRVVQRFMRKEVGCVTGQLRWRASTDSSTGDSTGLYWRLEHFLWKFENRLGILAWASGACMAFRKTLFRPMPPQFGDDCIIPLDVVAQGYRVVYDQHAIAYEVPATDLDAELRNRVRMTLRSFGGTLHYRRLLNPFRRPGIALSLISHKILRWLTPLLLLIAFLANIPLASSRVFLTILIAQLGFYIAAGTGYFADKKNIRIPVIRFITSFCVANLGMLLGTMKYFSGGSMRAYRFRQELSHSQHDSRSDAQAEL